MEWENRYNVRCFDDSVPVLEKDIQYLKNIFQYVPTQQSLMDNIWFTLTEEHNDFKIWLLENIFYRVDIEDGYVREYMVSLISAPLVFLSTIIGYNWSIQDAYRNSGIAAGAVGSAALKLGYDISFKGCTEGMFWKLGEHQQQQKNYDQKVKEFHEHLYKIFGKEIIKNTGIKETIPFHPGMVLCIGKGLPLTNTQEKYKKYKNYLYFSGQKRKKPWSGVI